MHESKKSCSPTTHILRRLFCCLLLPWCLGSCGEGVLAPAGPVGEAERLILFDSLAIMLAIVVPVILVTLAFAWWFRVSNPRARHLPDWSYSGQLELLVWAVPALVVLFLGGIAWLSSHALDPARPLDSKVGPLTVQVVSLDWKWLFIYPEQHIASINRLVVPSGVPLDLHITSATVMNVFFVPRLGSEIYAMNGMATKLNLEAGQPGDYRGLSAQFSGDGFAGMAFEVKAVTGDEFTSWVHAVQTGDGPLLDDAAYRALLKQTQNVVPYTYRTARKELFDDIVLQNLPPGDGPSSGKGKK